MKIRPRPCCVCNVRKSREAAAAGIRFFRFPPTKSLSLEEWTRAIRINCKKPSFEPKKTSVICSKHFTNDYLIRQDNKLSLKEGAKPTIFDLTSPIAESSPVVEEKKTLDEVQHETNNKRNVQDDASDSLSPPNLQLTVTETNSDYEENVEEPPDLDIYSDRHEHDKTTSVNLSDLDMIKMDHIGSVADILGPDPDEERPGSSGTEERVEVDGQTIISFASAEEMEEYIARQESMGNHVRLSKTKDVRQIKGWKGRFVVDSGQPTPSQSPSPSPSVYSDLSGTPAPSAPSSPVQFEEDKGTRRKRRRNKREVVESPSPMELPEPSNLHVPELGPEGLISAEYAKYAASALNLYLSKKLGPASRASTSKVEESPRQGAATRMESAIRKPVASPLKRKTGPVANQRRPASRPASPDGADIEQVLELDVNVMAGDDSLDGVPILEEEYQEEYDVPGCDKSQIPGANCTKPFCRMGCLCESLEAATKKKVVLQHCSRPECMIQCVCGFLPGKPRSRRSFVSLLKGNESFYSKINWTAERTRRERKVPERFSEFHLETDSRVPSPPMEEYLPRAKPGPKSARAMSSPNKLPNGDHPLDNADKKKAEPFRIKVASDEINLLRWDSYVPLTKVYVAPDQEVLCIEHSKYSCPCLSENRRIIRILSKFVPPNVQAGSKRSGANLRSVAKKHTHPSMRTAHLKKKVAEAAALPPSEENSNVPRAPDVAVQPPDKAKPANKVVPDGMSKMRKLLQDERFQLQKLMTQEKMRAFDDEVDLTIRSGQTVQLVAWIRFHSVYQSGKMHIRFLSRRAGPVILVMRPTEIVAADITCDIRDMRDKPNVPEIVKELLDPCISPEETCRYAFLLCDGVKWELVGCLSLKASTPTDSNKPGSSVPAKPTKPRGPPPERVAEPKSLALNAAADVPEVILEEQPLPPSSSNLPIKIRIQHKTSSLRSPGTADASSSNTDRPVATVADADRLSAMEQRRIHLEQRLSQINSKLSSGAPIKVSVPGRPTKSRHGSSKNEARGSDPLNSSASMAESRSPILPAVLRQSKAADSILLTPDQCILPDDPPNVPHATPEPTKYPAAETLAMFSRQAMSQLAAGVGVAPPLFPIIGPKGAPRTVIFPVTSNPLPAPLLRPPDVSLLRLRPVAPPAGAAASAMGRVRVIPPLQRMPSTSSSSLLNQQQLASNSLVDLIRMQRANKAPASTAVSKPANGESPGGVQSKAAAPESSPSPSTERPTSLPALVSIQTHSADATPKPSGDATSSAEKESPATPAGLTLTPDSPAVTTADAPSTTTTSTPSPAPSADPGSTPVDTPTPDAAPDAAADAAPDVAPAAVAAGAIEEAESIFPKVLATEISTVELTKSNERGTLHRRLKVSFGSLKGEHRTVSPTPSTMLLPLFNLDDQWCMIAVKAVPEGGIQIPGISVFIPRAVVGRAASTAVERKARVSFPLHVQGNITSPILKKGFGVYGTPQLPHHVFIGPFPTDYLDGCPPLLPCMMRIIPPKMEEPAPSISEERSPKAVEASTPDHQTATTSKQAGQTESATSVVSQSVQQPHPRSHDDRSPAPAAEFPTQHLSNGCTDTGASTSAAPEEALPGPSRPLRETSPNNRNDVEVVSNRPKSLPPPLPRDLTLPTLPRDFGTHKSTRPKRVFVARTQGLPTTTMAIFEDDLVLVRHPLKPEKSVSFTTVDAAKRWLQSLSGLNRSVPFTPPSERSEAANRASSSDAMDATETQERLGRNAESLHYMKRAATAEPSANGDPSPKRVRRLTEKARILAAQSSQSLRSAHKSPRSEPVTPTEAVHPALSRHASPPRMSTSPRLCISPPRGAPSSSTKRNSVARQLHIRKEQERRGLLGKLLRDLDSLIAPNSGIRAKIVVLKNATSTVKSLQEQNRALENQYHTLKTRRLALIKQRQKIFSELPADKQQIFRCLMDCAPLPTRHSTLVEARKRRAEQEALEEADLGDSRSTTGPEDSDEIDIMAMDAEKFGRQ